MTPRWQCGRFVLELDQPKIMGVLNCTPDSFSDGGQFLAPAAAIARARQMVAEGADIIDIGAESTRPGSQAISSEEEIRRLTPVVEALVAELGVPVSIDTKKAATMRAMLALGADIINDVHGLEDVGALDAVKDSNCGLCLMHMRGMPDTMQHNTDYADVLAEVDAYLQQRTAVCLAAGIAPERIALDPGFGFGKNVEQNLLLVKHIHRFGHERHPLLLGVSRKSTIGQLLGGVPPGERLVGSVMLAMLGVEAGAHILRVHDVRATKDALRIREAYEKV
ncbi:MAG: dihydropteroate synthase [Cardiobacteriaceae bacterium]|nr:dihydropteroate synthase [Cardiobacteriaceae bacterium]